jgi:hypothetical protein
MHEHDPAVELATVSLNCSTRNSHGVNERCLALEAMDSSLADLAKEIKKWNAKHQNLKHLHLVSALSS